MDARVIKGKRGVLSTPQEIAGAFLPGSARYIRVIHILGVFYFQVSIFPAFNPVDGLPCSQYPGTKDHEELCEELACEGQLLPARFILLPPIPLSFVENRELTLYQTLADAQSEESLERVFCEIFESELLERAHLTLSLGEGESPQPCVVAVTVNGICFETSFMLAKKGEMQCALRRGETPQDEHVDDFHPVFNLA